MPHWCFYEDGRIRLFDVTAATTEEGGWSVKIGANDSIAGISSEPLRGAILHQIQKLRSSGQDGRIDHIAIGPYPAVRLVLEGVITRELLSKAIETPVCITVVAELEGIGLKIVIRPGTIGYAICDTERHAV